jgi:hypothetical protein
MDASQQEFVSLHFGLKGIKVAGNKVLLGAVRRSSETAS